MENANFKRTPEDFEKHILRCCSCQNTVTFCYRPTSLNNYDILKTYFHCHSYFCEVCAKKKRNNLIKKMKNIKPGSVLRFLTVTLDVSKYTPESSLEKISEMFNMLVKYLRYRGFKFQYFKIIELTKQNIAHVHALINCYLPKSVLSVCWFAISQSYIVDIVKIHNAKMALFYITKYISKTMNYFANKLFYFLRKRRYSYSQSFFLPNEKEPPFILSRCYFFDDFDLFSVVNHYFRLHFNNYGLIRFNLLN